jgi:hypothetical protein
VLISGRNNLLVDASFPSAYEVAPDPQSERQKLTKS